MPALPARAAKPPKSAKNNSDVLETRGMFRPRERSSSTSCDRGLGDRTVEYAQAVLRHALQFAVEWEILDRNPVAARFRVAKRKRTVKPGGAMR